MRVSSDAAGPTAARSVPVGRGPHKRQKSSPTLPLAIAALVAPLLADCSTPGPQAAQATGPSCRVDTVADLPLVAGVMHPTVQASLAGRPVALVIDTGAFISMISARAAEQFDLRPGPDARYTTMIGVGGPVIAPIVTVKSLGLGHGIARAIDLPVGGNVTRTGVLADGTPVLGLLGADFLSNYDVDLDVPHRHFGLYLPHQCDAEVQPFDPPYFQVPFDFTDDKIRLQVRLDDKPLTAVFDSGASMTTIPRAEAAQIGVDAAVLAADRTVSGTGIDNRQVTTWLHRFKSLDVGDERLNNFRFGVASIETGDMLLGADFLRANRVWISYRRHLLTIQPIQASQQAGQRSGRTG